MKRANGIGRVIFGSLINECEEETMGVEVGFERGWMECA